jgi:hypothetical protein
MLDCGFNALEDLSFLANGKYEGANLEDRLWDMSHLRLS